MAPFVEVFGDANRYLGVETSEPMRAAATARFADAIRRSLVEIRDLDLRFDYPRVPASLTLAVLAAYSACRFSNPACHSRANFCASASCAGVICSARLSRNLSRCSRSSPLARAAARLYHLWASV